MKSSEECLMLVNELIDINVRQREIIRNMGRYAAESGGEEKLMIALENYLQKVDEQEMSLKALYIEVDRVAGEELLRNVKKK